MFGEISERALRRFETHVKGFKTMYDAINPPKNEGVMNFLIFT